MAVSKWPNRFSNVNADISKVDRNILPGKPSILHFLYRFQSGWGSKYKLKESTDEDFPEYTLTDALQEIDVPIPTKAYCRIFHGEEVSNLVFCGGVRRKGSMTGCHGDSGSPLICSDDSLKKPFVAGIVVGGDYLCETGYFFNILTEVAKYREWIDSVLIRKKTLP